jgi:hypothetical protein
MAGRGVVTAKAKDPWNFTPKAINLVNTNDPQIGDRFEADDGRVFYFGSVATTCTAGYVVQTAGDLVSTIAATYFGVDTSTAPTTGNGGAIGDTVIRVNRVGTTLLANEYKGGYLFFTSTGTGAGYAYKIKRHNACATSGTNACDIVIYEPGLVVALDATTVGAVIKSPWKDLTPVDADAAAVTTAGVAKGVAVRTMTVASSIPMVGWIQSWGPAVVLCDATTATAMGAGVVAGITTDGLVTLELAGTLGTAATGKRIGNCLYNLISSNATGTTSTHLMVDLTICR